jgi:hypothetical protein
MSNNQEIARDKWISGGYLIMKINILIAFAAIVAVIAIVFSIGGSYAEPSKMNQEDTDEAKLCFHAQGRFESVIQTCPGLCTKGKLTGSLNGDYEFTGNQSIPANEPTIPSVRFYTGFSRVYTINGELYLTDAGALEVPFGNLSSLLTVTGGTGDYAHSTGYLNIFGATYPEGTAKGKFEGMICK